MNYMRAAGSGLAAGTAAAAFMTAARALGVHINTELVLITFVSAPSSLAWIIGLIVEMCLCTAFGIAYVAVLTYWKEPIRMYRGALLAIPHLAIDGAALGILPSFHPRIPSEFPAPGSFYWHNGPAAIVTFALAHLVFGLVAALVYAHRLSGAEAGELNGPVYS